jgi:subtilisin family serine protease
MKSKVKAEKKFEFYDKVLDKKRSFSPNDAELVVSLNKDQLESLDSLSDSTNTMLLNAKAVDLAEGFAVIQKSDIDNTDSTAGEALADTSTVHNTLPSMVDEEGLTHYFMPDEFTVQFSEELDEAKMEAIIKKHGATIIHDQRTPGYYTLSVPKDKGLFEMIDQFNQLDEVVFAEAAEIGLNDELYIPNDPEFPKLWGLQNTGQVVNNTSGSNDADIDATLAWNYERGEPNVIIAVIDTGVDYTHNDLKNNILPQGAEDWNFASSFSDDPMDSGTHGTHVAGTSAAVDNTKGVIGVAPRCRIMPLRVNLTSGMNANRADAINYVAAQAVANPNNRFVINCSWRMSGHHTGVYYAIKNAVNKNVVVVFVAGNADRNIDVLPQYPAVYSEVIAVGATDQEDRRASFSNYGKKVDVSAPGVNIYSTIPGGSGDNYGFKNGTSMAAPHVAGLAGLIWSKNKTLTNAQVRKIIEATTDNIDSLNPGFVGLLGTGRINAYRAVSKTPHPPVKVKLLTSFPFPQKNAGSSTGMVFAHAIQVHPIRFFPKRPALLFVTQKAYSEKIYFLNPTNGAVMKAVDPPANDTLGSLAWDGTYIYGANVTWGAGSINKFSPFSGSVLGSMNVPAGRGEGLAVYGNRFYYSTINHIHIINKSNGLVVGSFPAPGGACHSLSAGDGYLFCGNNLTKKITILHISNNQVRGVINAPGNPRRADALAYESRGNRLYVANQATNRIYCLQLWY